MNRSSFTTYGGCSRLALTGSSSHGCVSITSPELTGWVDASIGAKGWGNEATCVPAGFTRLVSLAGPRFLRFATIMSYYMKWLNVQDMHLRLSVCFNVTVVRAWSRVGTPHLIIANYLKQ